MTTLNRRGRPKGTTKKGDDVLLQEMAKVMLIGDTKTPTAAIKKVVPEWTDTIIRRLLGKWKQHSPQLLAEMQQESRRQEKDECYRQTQPLTAMSGQGAFPAFDHAKQTRAMQLMEAMANNPAMQKAQGVLGNSVMRRAMGLDYDAVTRATMGYESTVAREFARTMEQVQTEIFGFTHRSMATGALGPYLEKLYGPRYASILKGSIL